MTTVRPFYWFEGRVGEAVAFYAGLFDDAEIVATTPWPPGSDVREDDLLSATLRLGDQEVILLNGGPHYALTPAASLMATCRDQDETDRLWEAFCDGGTPMRCGWVTDRFGMTWQVVPDQLLTWLSDPDREKAARVNEAMLTMDRLDIAQLKAAYDGTGA